MIISSAKTLYKICTTTNICADYLIRGKDNGFETDTLIELLDSMDKRSRESALRILREFADVVYQLKLFFKMFPKGPASGLSFFFFLWYNPEFDTCEIKKWLQTQ